MSAKAAGVDITKADIFQRADEETSPSCASRL
jgi:hypothetical protein